MPLPPTTTTVPEHDLFHYTCAACGTLHEIVDGVPPVGWWIDITRVTHHVRNRKPYIQHRDVEVFLCDKECAVNWLQYQAGSQMKIREML